MASADPLALPASPPPAPAGHRVRDAALVVLLALATLVPLAGLVVQGEPEALAFENRRAGPWPAGPISGGWRPWTAAFERAFADRFGGRDLLIRVHHAANALVFHRSPVPKVLIGASGWLYFTGEDARALERFHRGRPATSDAETRAVVDELARRSALLAAHGIAYVVTVVPDKATIYPEHLPSWVRRAEPAPLDRLAQALQDDGRVRFVDLRAPLAGVKASEPVYYRTDSHWNVAGAAVGYAALLGAAQHALPSFREALAPRPLPPLAPGTYSGDLAAMLGLPGRFREPDARPLWRLLADPGRCAKRLDDGTHALRETYGCDRPGLPTLVMTRDSMAIPLVPLVAEHFRRSLFLSGDAFDGAAVIAERPDLVIEQMVERRMLVPAAVPMREPRS